VSNLLQNITWETVIAENKALCERAGYQHGFTSEGYEESMTYFNECKKRELTFVDLVDELRILHKKAPFLFLNGNTFCSIGILIAEKERVQSEYLISTINHHIAGTNILDKGELRKLFSNHHSRDEKDHWDVTAQMIHLNLKRGFSIKDELNQIHSNVTEALKQGLIEPSSYLRVSQLLARSGEVFPPSELVTIKQELKDMKV